MIKLLLSIKSNEAITICFYININLSYKNVNKESLDIIINKAANNIKQILLKAKL